MPHNINEIIIGDLIEPIETGVSVNGDDRYPNETEPAVLKISSVTYGRFDHNSAKPITQKDIKRAKCTPKNGCILISRSNTPRLVGASVYLNKNYPYRYLPDKLWQLSPKKSKKFSMKWLGYYISSPLIRNNLTSLATGTSASMFNISQSDFLKMKILLPPLKSQLFTVEVLEYCDVMISKTEQLIAAKEKHLKVILARFLNPLMHNSDLVKLNQIAHIKTGKSDVNEGNPQGKYPFFTCAKEHTYSDKYSFDCEAILIAGNGNVGNPQYYNGKFDAYQRTYVLKNFTYNSQYILYWLKYFLQKIVDKEIQQGAMPYIKLTTLSNFHVANIPMTYQTQITQLFNEVEHEIQLLKLLITKYSAQKTGLMQKLLTGEWDIGKDIR